MSYKQITRANDNVPKLSKALRNKIKTKIEDKLSSKNWKTALALLPTSGSQDRRGDDMARLYYYAAV